MKMLLPGPARLRLRADQLRAGVRVPGPGGGVQHAGHLQRHAQPAAVPGQVTTVCTSLAPASHPSPCPCRCQLDCPGPESGHCLEAGRGHGQEAFSSSCQQCVAEQRELETRLQLGEAPSLSASVLSTKHLVDPQPPPEPRGRVSPGGERLPGRTYECEAACRAGAMLAVSTLGLSLAVLGYTLLGALVFSAVESRQLAGAGAGSPTVMTSNEVLATLSGEVNSYLDQLRGHTVSKLWQMTEQMNILYPLNWTHNAAEELLSFQRTLSTKLATEIMARPGYPSAVPLSGARTEEWSFSRGFLYSLTLLTTIGGWWVNRMEIKVET